MATQATTTAAPDGRSAEFRAVEGGPETRSGSVLLVEAYAAIWLILFGFLWLTFRRQRQLDNRITDLERSIHEAKKS